MRRLAISWGDQRYGAVLYSTFTIIALTIPLWVAVYVDKPVLMLGLPVWAGIMGALVLHYWRRDA